MPRHSQFVTALSAMALCVSSLAVAQAPQPAVTPGEVTSAASTQAVAGPVWAQLKSLPSAFSTLGGLLVNVGDRNVYGITSSGTAPNQVVSAFVAPQNNLANWSNITSPILSQNDNGTPNVMGMMPNGTVLMADSGRGVANVFYWNGSTTNPAWKAVTGYDGGATSSIYNFTNDSAGYTYFSPAWSGDIWRNDAPNSTNFTKLYTNLYTILGTGLSGGLYQTWVWNLGDGNGDMIWTCGEGTLMNVDLKFTKVTEYLNGPSYGGNCSGLAKSATNILAIRKADLPGDDINQISIATRKTNVVPSMGTITPQHYPSYMDTNLVNSLKWMYGTTWMLNNRANSVEYLLLSQDDGTTWTDITKIGGLPSSCTGSNLSVGATVIGHYILARCQGGKEYWVYGPV